MPTYLRPDLLTIDPAELSDYLLDLGIHSTTTASPEGLVITTDLDATDALAAFLPTSTLDRADPWSSTYRPKLPAYLADHISHLRDYRTLVRAGGTPTNAQTAHVVADLIDALRFVNARITGD